MAPQEVWARAERRRKFESWTTPLTKRWSQECLTWQNRNFTLQPPEEETCWCWAPMKIIFVECFNTLTSTFTCWRPPLWTAWQWWLSSHGFTAGGTRTLELEAKYIQTTFHNCRLSYLLYTNTRTATVQQPAQKYLNKRRNWANYLKKP